jgi:hypothetical protein
MHSFSRRRWLLALGLLLLLAMSTVPSADSGQALSLSKGTIAASGPAPVVQLIHIGTLRAGLAGNYVGALSRLAAPATPIRMPAGTTLALEASVEAVFFRGTGVADPSAKLRASFGLTLEDTAGRLLDYDDRSASGTGPQREPGYLRVETTLDTLEQSTVGLDGQILPALGGTVLPFWGGRRIIGISWPFERLVRHWTQAVDGKIDSDAANTELDRPDHGPCGSCSLHGVWVNRQGIVISQHPPAGLHEA